MCGLKNANMQTTDIGDRWEATFTVVDQECKRKNSGGTNLQNGTVHASTLQRDQRIFGDKRFLDLKHRKIIVLF